jgi:hypothetical protein
MQQEKQSELMQEFADVFKKIFDQSLDNIEQSKVKQKFESLVNEQGVLEYDNFSALEQTSLCKEASWLLLLEKEINFFSEEKKGKNSRFCFPNLQKEYVDGLISGELQVDYSLESFMTDEVCVKIVKSLPN